MVMWIIVGLVVASWLFGGDESRVVGSSVWWFPPWKAGKRERKYTLDQTNDMIKHRETSIKENPGYWSARALDNMPISRIDKNSPYLKTNPDHKFNEYEIDEIVEFINSSGM